VGGRMHRAVVLLWGLLLALAAAVVVALPATGIWGPAALPAPAATAPRPVQSPAEAAPAAENAQSSSHAPVMRVSRSAPRVRWWAEQSLLVAGLLAVGLACPVVWTLARGAPLRRRGRPEQAVAPAAADRRSAPRLARGARASSTSAATVRPRAAAEAPAALPSRPEQLGEQYPAEPRSAAAGHAGPSQSPVDWLRSEAGDSRAAAALCAVDAALAAGGWRSRAIAAATQPGAQQPQVRVSLALHPAERALGRQLADRMRTMHPAWPARAEGDCVTVDVHEQTRAPGSLVLPALQRAEEQPWTDYLYAPAAIGLAITGAGAAQVLHGVLADLVCMFPPGGLALTVLGEREAELYRAAPQWAEPPATSPAAIEHLAQLAVSGETGAALRPLLLAALEPDDEWVRALLALERRLRVLRVPPIALLVAAERPSAQFRVLAAALPALAVHAQAGCAVGELRFGERRINGYTPHFEADDARELLRWLPRFGASPPPCIWDTIASSAD